MLRSIACILVILLGGITLCMVQGIEQFPVLRGDTYHESWPDVALAARKPGPQLRMVVLPWIGADLCCRTGA